MRRLSASRLVLITLSTLGCATSGGDALIKSGAYADAASAYDGELAAHPGDLDLERKRTAAREGALRAKLEQARGVRTSGHGEAAVSMLGEALRLQARWALEPAGDLKALRDAEITGAGQTMEAAVQAELTAHAPLRARERVDKLAPLFDGPLLQPIVEAAKNEIAAAGSARCAELAGQPRDQAPYLGRMLASYCARLAGPSGSPFTAAAAPEQSRGLRVSGRLEHATAAQQQIIESWLAEVFRNSPWFASDAAALTPLELKGVYDARLERQRVLLSAPYRAVVHSTVTEGLMGLGPTATVETETERVFEYEAEQYDARYALDATFSFDFTDGPLSVSTKNADSRRAYQHQVSFPQANVYPQRANLADVNTWLTTLLHGKKAAMVRKLRARWTKAYCSRTSFTAEEAARCLQGGDRRPSAQKALAAVFGNDLGILIDDLSRSPVDAAKDGGAKPPAAPRKAAPEIQEVPQGGGETI